MRAIPQPTYISDAENIINARAICTVFVSDRDEELE